MAAVTLSTLSNPHTLARACWRVGWVCWLGTA